MIFIYSVESFSIDDLEEAVKMNERLNQLVTQKEERINTLQERFVSTFCLYSEDFQFQVFKREFDHDLQTYTFKYTKHRFQET